MTLTYNEGLVLVSGPVKSGKSLLAEKIALSSSSHVKYVATHIEIDDSLEWQNRIQKHKDRRPSNWVIIENNQLIAVLKEQKDAATLLIDSLGGFVTFYLHYDTIYWTKLCQDLINEINLYEGLVIIVIEEVGWGVSPSTDLGNIFRDRIGELTLLLEDISTTSWLVFHNRALNLSTNSIKI